MKKKLSLVLALCLLICTFCINPDAAESTNQTAASIAEANSQVAAILKANPDYRTMVSSSGKELIVDSNNLIINQILVNVDQVLDVEAYNDGEIDNFFGVEITTIEPIFEEDWIDDIIEKIGYKFSYLITVPYGSDIQAAIDTIKNNEHVWAVAQNGIVEDCTIEYDPETAATGHFDLIGVSYAWESGFVGSHDTRIAVIDRGAIPHEEFDNNMRFDLGYNARYLSNPSYGSSPEDVTPIPTDPNRAHGHIVSGIIGADYGDGGVNGICQNISMIPILRGSACEEIERGVIFAILENAKVINLSAYMPSDFSLNIINGVDVLVVVAAGNNYQEMTPANDPTNCNDLDNYIVVGNSTVNDAKVESSNHSTTYVDLFAPGHLIKTVGYPTGTTNGSGTSSAAPVVAGAAALIRSHATHLTAAQTKDLILNNVDVIPDFENYCVTGGRLAIDKMVDALYAEARGAYSKGDVTGDGAISSMDKMFAQRIAIGTMTPNADQFYAADVNKDGVVNTTDVDMISGFFYSTCYFPPV